MLNVLDSTNHKAADYHTLYHVTTPKQVFRNLYDYRTAAWFPDSRGTLSCMKRTYNKCHK
jgi:hypothetical protein